MHAYLMQFMVGMGTNFEANELKKINHFSQQDLVQIICTNANCKFGDHSFTENVEYCDTIEKTNATIEVAKATGKTTYCGTKHEKFQSKTTQCKHGKSKKNVFIVV